tara:strand:- start:57 stop:266 length:210 start_codon:yes stop_codon:yes gene_type:complete
MPDFILPGISKEITDKFTPEHWAKLISLAPDMLSELELTLAWVRDYVHPGTIGYEQEVSELENIINKAN